VAKPRYLWPRTRLAQLASARDAVQAHAEAAVSLVSPLGEHPAQYRNVVFFWLPDHSVGIVWQATLAQHVQGDLAKRIASQMQHAVWRSQNPERECLDCRKSFLPSQGWDEAGYPHDLCPVCVGRRIALLGPDQVMGTPFDPRAIVRRPPREPAIADLDRPIGEL